MWRSVDSQMVWPLAGGGTVHKLCLCGCAHACVTVDSLLSQRIMMLYPPILVPVMLTPRKHTLCGPL